MFWLIEVIGTVIGAGFVAAAAPTLVMARKQTEGAATTAIVRMVIVPATMVLLGEWNWYLPRWLEWLPRMDLPEESAAQPVMHPAAAPVSAGD